MHRWFVLVFVVVFACSDDADPIREYEGDVDPCDVTFESGTEADPVKWPAVGQYEQPGGYAVWNTAPKAECRNNPTVSVGELVGKELYITYPSASTPTVSGNGRVADGKFPVIVFAHANNDRVCNIFERYFTIQEHWASYGFIVISIDGTDTNCKPGNTENLQLRSDAQLAGLDEIRRLNDDPNSVFYQHVDTEKFLFAGHSRGGGSSLVSARNTPGVSGVIDLQGVDLSAFGFGSAVLPDFPVIGLTAGLDVDLNYPHCEPTEDMLGGIYTWVNINGGVHANTADTAPLEPDDTPEISKEEQHQVIGFFTAAFLHQVVGLNNDWPAQTSRDVLFSHTGAQTVAARGLSPKGVFTRWRDDSEKLLIDTFDGKDADLNLLGGETSSIAGFASENATYKPEENPVGGMYGKSYSLRLKGAPAGSYRTILDASGAPLAVAKDWAIEARVKGPDTGDVGDLFIIMETESGELRVNALEFGGPVALSNRFTQIHVPLTELSDQDLGVLAIRLESSMGEVFVDDLRFSAP